MRFDATNLDCSIVWDDSRSARLPRICWVDDATNCYGQHDENRVEHKVQARKITVFPGQGLVVINEVKPYTKKKARELVQLLRPGTVYFPRVDVPLDLTPLVDNRAAADEQGRRMYEGIKGYMHEAFLDWFYGRPHEAKPPVGGLLVEADPFSSTRRPPRPGPGSSGSPTT